MTKTKMTDIIKNKMNQHGFYARSDDRNGLCVWTDVERGVTQYVEVMATAYLNEEKSDFRGGRLVYRVEISFQDKNMSEMRDSFDLYKAAKQMSEAAALIDELKEMSLEYEAYV